MTATFFPRCIAKWASLLCSNPSVNTMLMKSMVTNSLRLVKKKINNTKAGGHSVFSSDSFAWQVTHFSTKEDLRLENKTKKKDTCK